MNTPELPSTIEHLRAPIDRRDAWLLFALSCGPLAVGFDEAVSYALAPTACELGSKGWLHLVFLVSLLLSLGGAVLAWRLGRRLAPESVGEGGVRLRRARFMASIGQVSGSAFALVLVAMEVPNWTLGVCQ